MARMRRIKNSLRGLLEDPAYGERLGEIEALGMAAVAPLISCLPLPDPIRARAAAALGHAVAAIAARKPEEARNVLRRLMWHMNEDSGNLGWGVPEAFARILARSEGLAAEFHRILLSYIMDTGKADNYCDYGPLRRCCYTGAAILAASRPDLAASALPALVAGLRDEDRPCRGYAAYALGFLRPGPEALEELKALARDGGDIPCAVFDGRNMRETSAAELAREALAACAP